MSSKQIQCDAQTAMNFGSTKHMQNTKLDKPNCVIISTQTSFAII